ncbi:MAG TPA: DNA mismatch repair protein MutT, partial [Chromatiales bacterium]|nr:DNA mismatch repair protein MutT [Chromatiales bacterium]
MSGHAVHVAVGVVRNAADEILIARRPDGVHQGGKWEFPGG